MTANPTNVSEINARINNGQVKVKTVKGKGSKPPKASSPAAEQPTATSTSKRKAPSDEQFYEALQAIVSATGKPTHSRALSDKLGIKNSDFGRGAARAAMRRLAAAHKVRIVTASEGKTKFSYTPLDA